MQTDLQALAYKGLEQFWGYQEFNELQKESILSIINGRDTLVLLPTGAGKSLCYQLPAIILEGTCLVISPLLALIREQVNSLKRRGIEAEYISSEMDEIDIDRVFNYCNEGLTKILFVSPERLTNSYFIKRIEDVQISFIAVDEAHCISEWGQDFRPSYKNIKPFREHIKNVPIIALTATATQKVILEITSKLNLQNPEIFQKSFRRDNIKIIINQISDKYQYLLDFMKYNNNAGIVYTRTRKEAEELCNYLQKSGIKNVDFFHAGLSAKEKNIKQNRWQNSNHEVLISTNAFGMGIDKNNVRFVIHFNPTNSIENYFQEIGRAGRDGLESIALMLWNEQELHQFDNILKSQIPNKNEYLRVVSTLYTQHLIAEGEKSDHTFQFNIQNLQEKTKVSRSKIKNILTFLNNNEVIYYNSTPSKSSLVLKISISEIDDLASKDSYFLELLIRNLPGLSSGKVYFSIENLSQKIGIDTALIKNRIKELQDKNYLSFVDGSLASIRFITERNTKVIENYWWNLFVQIQKNKLQKWEEMKFFVTDQDYCKMKLILSYFGEKNVNDCGICYVCKRKKEKTFGNQLSYKILEELKQAPASVEELCYKLSYTKKEKILETLILLLDSEKIKMKDFRTYTINN